MAQQDAPFFAPGAYDADAEQIRRRLQYAQSLRQNQDPLQGQMVSGHYVRPSWMEGLANMLKSYVGGRMEDQASQDLQDLSTRRNQEQAQDLSGVLSALRGTPAVPEQQGPQAQGGSPELAAQPAVAPDPNEALVRALSSKSPMVQQLGQSLAQSQISALAPKGNKVVGRSLINEGTGQVVGVDATWQAEQQAAREARKAELEARIAAAATTERQRAEDRAELVRLTASLRQPPAERQAQVIQTADGPMQLVNGKAVPITGPDGNPVKGKGDVAAKLPTPALKLQQEELDALGTASGISADVNALQQQIKDGKLNLGLMSNAMNSARNAVGISTPDSQNLAAFKASIAKLRNDSLRLNKGVQTEGDAVRAMDELIAGINDPAVVTRQLARINEINQRAITLRRANIDQIRRNFGVDPMDDTAYTNQPAALGTGAPKRIKYDAQGNVVP